MIQSLGVQGIYRPSEASADEFATHLDAALVSAPC
jgi:hypothetical protein